MGSFAPSADMRDDPADDGGETARAGPRIYVSPGHGDRSEMKKTIFLLGFAALWLAAVPVRAQKADAGPTIDGVARSASLMRQIGESCPLLMDVNTELAERYVQAFVETGEQAFGKDVFQKKLASEYERRAAEVKKKTPESWCLDQRSRLKDMGGGDLFTK